MRKPQTSRRLAFVAASLMVVLLAGCGGSNGEDEDALAYNPNPPPQCGVVGNCPPSGFDIIGPEPKPLCADALDYGTVFTGGSGAGELVKMKFDTTRKIYELQILESPVPRNVGDIFPTRAGVTFTGTYANLTNLPTAEQNRCALELRTAQASVDSSQAVIDPAQPPIIYLGHGVAGGGIPGATIAYGGILGIGAIPETTFNMYPVLAFSEIETDFNSVGGTYNYLGFHMVPSGGSIFKVNPFAIATGSGTEVLHADGTCSRADGQACLTTGSAWVARGDGAFESANDARRNRYPSFFGSAVTPQNFLSRARGIMVVGKLRGARVPVVVRVGYARISRVSIDDESGMAILAPNTPLVAGQLNGGYVGSGSDFKYTVSVVKDSTVTLLDPQTQKNTGRYTIDWNQSTPGVATTVGQDGAIGQLIASGPVFAHLADNTFRASVFAAP